MTKSYQAPLLHLSTLPYPRFTIGKPPKSIEYTLPVPLFAEQWTVPAGITVKLITTRDFGIVVVPPGILPVKRFFKY